LDHLDKGPRTAVWFAGLPVQQPELVTQGAKVAPSLAWADLLEVEVLGYLDLSDHRTLLALGSQKEFVQTGGLQIVLRATNLLS
jgi:hypothetical protein